MGSSAARTFDAVVVGAGPAGAVVSRQAAQRGLRVALLERTAFDDMRIGESLAPGVQAELRALGLWQDFLEIPATPSWGTRSIWGTAELNAHSHIVSPYGNGWHVDRRQFDAMLAATAARAGVELRESVAIGSCERRNGLWELSLSHAARRPRRANRLLRARVLVDATGRRARIARLLGARHFVTDRLVGIAVRFQAPAAAEERSLLVESDADGWWYCAPLPVARGACAGAIAVYMTDAEHCSARRLGNLDNWLAALETTSALRERLRGGVPLGNPRVYRASSQRLLRRVGPDANAWIAVGDAAMAVDPISGSGVPRAIAMARSAGEAIVAMLQGETAASEAVASYEAALDRDYTSYLGERARYYAYERRYSTSFWRRRSVE